MAARGSKRKAVPTRSRAKAGDRNKLTIDFDRYLPTVLSSLVAKLRANANVFFTASYGVSLAEWRILSFLAEHGPASAYDIWTRSGLDKAVVSRETGTLGRQGAGQDRGGQGQCPQTVRDQAVQSRHGTAGSQLQ